MDGSVRLAVLLFFLSDQACACACLTVCLCVRVSHHHTMIFDDPAAVLLYTCVRGTSVVSSCKWYRMDRYI